jgi:quinol monooxygenase YgiN
MTVALVAQLHTQVGRVTEVKELLADLATSASRDPACGSYHVAFIDEPGECLLVSSWKGEASGRVRVTLARARHRRLRRIVS